MELDILKTIVAGVMKVDTKELELTTTYVEDLGADSLDLARIIMEIEDKFSIILPKDSVYNVNTLEDTLGLIKNFKAE